MEWITEPQAWIAFLTLTALELVLGIDNIIFISILAGKLPPEQRKKSEDPRPGTGDDYARAVAVVPLVDYQVNRSTLYGPQSGDLRP